MFVLFIQNSWCNCNNVNYQGLPLLFLKTSFLSSLFDRERIGWVTYLCSSLFLEGASPSNIGNDYLVLVCDTLSQTKVISSRSIKSLIFYLKPILWPPFSRASCQELDDVNGA